MKDRIRVLTLGARRSGKTELLRRINGDFQIMAPTIGCRLESLDTGSTVFTCLDMGADEKLLPVWEHIYRDVDSILLVVDSSDRSQLKHVRRYLAQILAQRSLNACQLIVAANKQDVPGALCAEEIAERLDLHKLRGRQWNIVETCATSGRGVEELMDNFVPDEIHHCQSGDWDATVQMNSFRGDKRAHNVFKSSRFQTAFCVAKALPKGFAFTGLTSSW